MAAEPDVAGADRHIQPMRRRHLRAVLRIEQQVYPRPWSSSLFLSELALRVDARVLSSRAVGRELVGYAGLMMTLDEGARHDHRRRPAAAPGARSGPACCCVLAREAIGRGATALTLEVRMSNNGAQDMYRRFGFAPVGVRKNYYQEVNEDALVMWAHEVDQPAYAELLDVDRAHAAG